jgi:ArsR family transcriptional regulator
MVISPAAVDLKSRQNEPSRQTRSTGAGTGGAPRSHQLKLINPPLPPVPLAPAPAPPALDPDQARLLLKALADPIRLQVIEALGNGERCVCELTTELGLAQSKLSFHLKVLKDAGLLADRQSGRWIYYQLRPQALESLRSWLAELASSCTAPAHPCC